MTDFSHDGDGLLTNVQRSSEHLLDLRLLLLVFDLLVMGVKAIVDPSSDPIFQPCFHRQRHILIYLIQRQTS